jgi:hypothetical protein
MTQPLRTVPTGSIIDLSFTDQLSWMDAALCVQVAADPEAWFTRSHAEAVKVCRICPVRETCGLYAQRETDLGNRLEGVWGGRSEGERRVTAHHHRVEARAAAMAAAANLVRPGKRATA